MCAARRARADDASRRCCAPGARPPGPGRCRHVPGHFRDQMLEARRGSAPKRPRCPRSLSIVCTRSSGQPSATARSRSSYWRCVLSVFSSTWCKSTGARRDRRCAEVAGLDFGVDRVAHIRSPRPAAHGGQDVDRRSVHACRQGGGAARRAGERRTPRAVLDAAHPGGQAAAQTQGATAQARTSAGRRRAGRSRRRAQRLVVRGQGLPVGSRRNGPGVRVFFLLPQGALHGAPMHRIAEASGNPLGERRRIDFRLLGLHPHDDVQTAWVSLWAPWVRVCPGDSR